MGITASIVSAVLKSVVGDKLGSGLAKDLIGISIDGISEKGIKEITDFINKGKSKIDSILSEENMQSMGISEEKTDYVVAEIKDLFSKISITDEVLRQCKYSSKILEDFMWNEYLAHKSEYIECESEIKRSLFGVAEELIKLVRESEYFEKEVLIHISNSVDEMRLEEQIDSQDIMNKLDRLEESNQEIYHKISVNSYVQNIESKVIKSKTQEYADKWEANMFLNDFDEWDENASVNVKLSDVYIDEHLPHFIYGRNKKESDNLDFLLSTHIMNINENKMLLVLGQPGIGKSTLITWITANFNERIDDILVYRFASDLGNTDWKSERISNRILEELGLNHNDLNRKILILDGFDEVSIEANRRKDILDSLYGDWIYNTTIDNFSLIVTCRENYIQEFEWLKCKYITLQPWDEIQIRSFCNIFQEKTKNNISEVTIEKLLENKEILGIPLILYMVLALNISIEKEGSIVDVYDKIFSLEGGIYDRCIDNKMFADKHRISIIKKQIHQISRKIAMWMFENNSEGASISYDEYEEICYAVSRAQDKDSKSIEQDVKIGNFFKLVNHCEGVETEELCFVHRSIYEYFVIETIFTSIKEAIDESKERLASVFGSLFKKGKLSINILNYLKHKIFHRKSTDIFDFVNNTFQLMLRDGMTYYTKECYKNIIDCEMNVFTNMLEFLHLWEYVFSEVSTLNFADFIICNRGLKLNLSYANLSELNLRNVDLKNADLRNANLKRINLSGANLSKADLSKADLDGAVLVGTNFTEAKLENAYLVRVNLDKAIMTDADLSNADISMANMNGTYLLGTKLNGTDLRGMELKKIDFRQTDLRGANLSWTILTEANFQDAIINGIILENADMTDVIFDKEQIEILEKEYDFKDMRVYIRTEKGIVNYNNFCKKAYKGKSI